MRVIFDWVHSVRLTALALVCSSTCPTGKQKFVVNNEDNVKRAQQGHRNALCDDCGAWQDGRIVKAYILRSNRKQIRHLNRVYCQRKLVNKKLVDVPNEPQPAAVEVVRYYCKAVTGLSHHIETTDAGLDGLCIREISVYHTNL